MKPLNPLLYLKNNFKSALPIFLSLTIGVFFIYIFALFSATTDKMIRVASFDVMEKYNVAYTNDDSALPHLFLEELKSINESDMIAVQINLSGLAYYRGGMGGTTMHTFNVLEEDTLALLDSYGIELTEGKLPQNNKNEILVPHEYALQNHLNVGDSIGSEMSDEYTLQGKYRICGLTEGEVVFAVSCQPGSKTKEDVMSRGIMYRVDNLSSAEQKRLIDSLPDNVITLTRDYYEQEYAITLNSMQLLTYILTAVMVIILCIALSNLNVILFANRHDELTILHSVGYAKGKLSRKLWMENLLVCLSGYIAGIGLTEIVVCLINVIILYPQGKLLELISLNGLLASLSMPIFVSIFSLFPCLTSGFQNIKTEY
jgi:putative ABC transport system permease protein